MSSPSLPNELVAEILSYFRCDPPTSLDGLQVALASRSLYNEFQPYISTFHIERLVGATTPTTKNLHISLTIRVYDVGGRGLFLGPEDFRMRAREAFSRTHLRFGDPEPLKSDPPVELAFPDLEASYHIAPYSLNDTSTIWSLQSLLSRPSVIPHLRRFTLRWGTKRKIDPKPTAAWQRALISLMQACVSAEGVELVFMGTLSSGEPLLGPSPQLKPSAFRGSRLSKVSFEGIALTTFWRPYLDSLLTQSASTLTHLRITSSENPPGSQWESTLSGEWGLHRLKNFEITGTQIPFRALTKFLLAYPSIVSATISVPQLSSERGSLEHLIAPGTYSRFLPHLRELRGTSNFLLALFRGDTSPALLPCLNKLSVLGDDRAMSIAESDDTLNYGKLTRLLECLPTRLEALELHIPYCPELEGWLKSASAAKSESPILQEVLDGEDSWGALALAGVRAARLPSWPPRFRPVDRSRLSQISSIDLTFFVELDGSAGYPPNYAIHPVSIVAFLSAFPRLRTATVDGAFYRPENVVKNAEQLWKGIGKTWDVCSALERLEIRKIGGSYTPAVWRRGEAEPTPGFNFNDWAASFLMVI